MKTFRIPKFALFPLLAFAVALLASTAHADEDVSITATLILASNDAEGVDSSLRQYERKLLRAFPFDTFKTMGSGSATVPLKGSQTITFSGGQKLTVGYKSHEDGKYRISAVWKKGSKTLVDLIVLASPGWPTVQAASSPGGTLPILILVVE